MSDTNAQEPTMEEILASIRRIISEDDTPAAAAPAVAEAAPEPPHAETAHVVATPTPLAHVEPEDDVLELTEPLDPPTAHVAAPAPVAEPAAYPAPSPSHFEETVGDLDVFSHQPSAAPAPSYTPPAYTPPPVDRAEEPLVGAHAAESSAIHFGALARSVTMPKEGRSLEDVVREMLKPMLRDWLDTNLPGIVEARVQAEVERIARRHEY
jgi:cell pole-organizing protein PopZ